MFYFFIYVQNKNVQAQELLRVAQQDADQRKFTDGLITKHELEIEKINERHRNEIKKYHVRIHTNADT